MLGIHLGEMLEPVSAPGGVERADFRLLRECFEETFGYRKCPGYFGRIDVRDGLGYAFDILTPVLRVLTYLVDGESQHRRERNQCRQQHLSPYAQPIRRSRPSRKSIHRPDSGERPSAQASRAAANVGQSIGFGTNPLMPAAR